MRTETPAPVRLEDYRPPSFRIDTVELDIRLAPRATRVAARLTIRREADAPADAPLVLDGDELTLVSLALDGQVLAADRYRATPSRLEIDKLPDGPPVLLGNGNPIEQGEVPGTDRHYAIWHDPHPKPSVSLRAGRRRSRLRQRHLHHHVRAGKSRSTSMWNRASRTAAVGNGKPQGLDEAGTKKPSGASTTWTSS
jgi:aminopeptidase N